ncbi:hypothetical protein N7481_009418 [Penicillium waksmanii]|uniref:uncharacterized protein n=1 Tax=Penicillium waksmanii TaxID=69791 RepID=UPI002547373F|nr:uncharacterized protein N7481_009418 [Penicillium waksmanii]KAJ5975711.1 hypothetical protein N7481_009418 [Penicillium waksmanii]
MDFYGTASTAITQLYQVTVFIQGVISDYKSFDDDRAEIRSKLNTQLATLVFFKRICCHPDHGLILTGKPDDFIASTVNDLLDRMRLALAAYERVAVNYGLGYEEFTIESVKPKVEESLIKRWKSKAEVIKHKAVDWSLFDKKRLNVMLETYTGLSGNLRDLMQHISQEMLAIFLADHREGLKGTGLEPVLTRRNLAENKAPADYHELAGTITKEGKKTEGFQLGKWSALGSEATQVVVEYHEYESELKRDDLEKDEIDALKKPIHNLAWILQNSTFTGTETESLDQPKIYALECLGFVDQPTEEQTVFLYKLPESEGEVGDSLTTLHAFVNAVDGDNRLLQKPSLNDRFSMAYTLALSLSNVHASCWVHKNIWSKGILLFLETPSGVSAKDLHDHRIKPRSGNKIVSYLSDWGYARSDQQNTDMRSDFKVEPNLYRHPRRQGRPTQQFSRVHDIYALGVVLLEIGLWVTLSRIMQTKIRDAEVNGRLPRPKAVLDELVARAALYLPKEMGMGYTQAVLACLREDFRGTDGPSLAVDFQEKVIDVLKGGVKM